MQWKIIEHNGRYLVCRKTWHSSDWMGLEKKDIRMLSVRGRQQAYEVFADCLEKSMAEKILGLRR